EKEGRVERYDYAKEHEFRLLQLEPERVVAESEDGGRDLRQTPPLPRPSAEEGDTAYTLLAALLEPSDAPRAGTLSGDYVVRLGSDETGVDCSVSLDTTT